MPYHQALEALMASSQEKTLVCAMSGVTARYHEASGAGAHLVTQREEALSYAAARMDATRAAAQDALSQLKLLMPGFAPRTALDVGAGTGAATWAALDVFPSLEACVCAERERVMSEVGSALFAACGLSQVRYTAADAARPDAAFPAADLVMSAYMLNELTPSSRESAVRALWNAASGALVLVEPGTRVGFENILQARKLLLDAGAHLLAPCPHARDCPLGAQDWCHFTRRVARTRLQKRLKGGEAPYEDEHFSYLCVTREAAAPCCARILRHPQIRPGHIVLTLCTTEGIQSRTVTKKEKEAFRAARNASAGDAWDESVHASRV